MTTTTEGTYLAPTVSHDYTETNHSIVNHTRDDRSCSSREEEKIKNQALDEAKITQNQHSHDDDDYNNDNTNRCFNDANEKDNNDDNSLGKVGENHPHIMPDTNPSSTNAAAKFEVGNSTYGHDVLKIKGSSCSDFLNASNMDVLNGIEGEACDDEPKAGNMNNGNEDAACDDEPKAENMNNDKHKKSLGDYINLTCRCLGKTLWYLLIAFGVVLISIVAIKTGGAALAACGLCGDGCKDCKCDACPDCHCNCDTCPDCGGACGVCGDVCRDSNCDRIGDCNCQCDCCDGKDKGKTDPDKIGQTINAQKMERQGNQDIETGLGGTVGS